MSRIDRNVRWSVQQRLEFIEFRLYWEGQVNRSDLVEVFGVSVPQASGDLSRYQELASRNIRYDKRLKAYVPTGQFTPLFLIPSAHEYLADLRLVSDGVLSRADAWMGWAPPFDLLRSPQRTIDNETLRAFILGIRRSEALRIHYQPLNEAEPGWRWITPHALAYDGFRWHVRAWSHQRAGFRDYVLARVLELGERKPHHIDPNQDLGWVTTATLVIGPHPGLNDARRRAIELDYGMTNGTLEIPTRLCLVFYLKRLLRLDLDASQRLPEEQQVVLLNEREVGETERSVAQQEEARAAVSSGHPL